MNKTENCVYFVLVLSLCMCVCMCSAVCKVETECVCNDTSYHCNYINIHIMLLVIYS